MIIHASVTFTEKRPQTTDYHIDVMKHISLLVGLFASPVASTPSSYPSLHIFGSFGSLELKLSPLRRHNIALQNNSSWWDRRYPSL